MDGRKRTSIWAALMMFGVAAGIVMQRAFDWEWGMAVAMVVASGIALLIQQRKSA
ncbi:MAG TPA: hypothetical protein VD886_08695 [Herpetosiphonaceae bacterium]|nr:hypothetical protein [Herpetosiphonaceae bacterium]